MREQAECRHRKDGVCTCPTNTFAPFKCPYADPDASQKEGYIPCPDWGGASPNRHNQQGSEKMTVIWVHWDECDGYECWGETQCCESWEEAVEYMKKQGKKKYEIEVEV